MIDDASIPARAMRRRDFLRKLAAILLPLPLPLFAACSGPFSTPATREEQRRNIETNFNATLARCYLVAPSTRGLVGNAVAVLAFPTVGLVNPVTGEWGGMGVLREGVVFTAYFYLSIPKFESESQAETRSIVFLFNSLGALNKFRVSNPWRASEAEVLTLVLRGNTLMTNPAMPDRFVVPLDT